MWTTEPRHSERSDWYINPLKYALSDEHPSTLDMMVCTQAHVVIIAAVHAIFFSPSDRSQNPGNRTSGNISASSSYQGHTHTEVYPCRLYHHARDWQRSHDLDDLGLLSFRGSAIPAWLAIPFQFCKSSSSLSNASTVHVLLSSDSCPINTSKRTGWRYSRWPNMKASSLSVDGTYDDYMRCPSMYRVKNYRSSQRTEKSRSFVTAVFT